MLNLHNLPKNKMNASRKKRLGRGNASGSGNYSNRGMKGQKARSGGKSGLTARSIKGYLLRIPKTRGFKSFKPKMAVVNLIDLDKNFENGITIKTRDMLKAGLVKSIANGVKVLSSGKLNKKFTIEADAFSVAAKEQIAKAGGKAVEIKAKENKEDSQDSKVEVKKTDK